MTCYSVDASGLIICQHCRLVLLSATKIKKLKCIMKLKNAFLSMRIIAVSKEMLQLLEPNNGALNKSLFLMDLYTM